MPPENILDSLKTTSNAFLAEQEQGLKDLLQKLQVGTEDIQELALAALKLGVNIMSDKLVGKDTTIAEKAIRSVRYDLVSASSTVVAGAVMGYIQQVIDKAKQALFTALMVAV